jgi:hypothetical protein
MTRYKLLFESRDYATLNAKSGTVFEMIDLYYATPRSPAIGMYQTKSAYVNVSVLKLLERNLRNTYNVGESVIISLDEAV